MNHHWKFCPFSWGLEEYVTIESSAGRLILCEYVYKKTPHEEEGHSFVGESRPVLREELEIWAGDVNEIRSQ